MAATAEINKYLSNHYEGMSPEQLILVLYKAALDRIQLAKEGIEENNIQKRGENLSKAIAIISELNASVDANMNDESTQFLRGLYKSILAELPKVSINNDTEILRKTHGYISKLKEIWETEVMGKQKINGKAQQVNGQMPGKLPGQRPKMNGKTPPAAPAVKPGPLPGNAYSGQTGQTRFQSFSV